MTTLNTIINGSLQAINEQIIDDLMGLGYDHASAVKVVTEFEGFDLVADANENPADLF
jgi:hypothetical protein